MKEELIDALGFAGCFAFALFVFLLLSRHDFDDSLFFSLGIFVIFFCIIFFINMLFREFKIVVRLERVKSK